MRVSIRLLGLVSVIILARLLVPEDYGIVAKAAMVFSFLELITAFGLDKALIHNQRAHRGHYDTVWTLHILRGGAIGAILVLLARPAAMFFHQPELEAILYCYAGISLLGGLVNVGIVDFVKKLQFHLDFKYHVYCKISAFVATVAFAYWYRSYWAFVVGSMAGALVGVLASFRLSGYRPRLGLSEWRSLFDFSKWVLVYQLVGAVSSKIDVFLLGRLSTTEQLGLYTVSQEVAGAASTEIAMPVGRAVMPGLATLNDNMVAFRELYVSALSMTLLVALPAALGVSVLSQQIADLLLGAKWTEAGPVIGLLAFFGIARVFGSMSMSAYIASGRVAVMSKLSFVNLITRSAAIGGGFYLGGFWGLVWGVLTAAGVNTLISLSVQRYIGLILLRQLLRRIWRVALSALAMWGLLLQAPIQLGAGSLVDLGASVLAGVAVYGVTLAALWWMMGLPDGPERQFLRFFLRRDRSSAIQTPSRGAIPGDTN
jgi:lipopolysaccharide exporter